MLNEYQGQAHRCTVGSAGNLSWHVTPVTGFAGKFGKWFPSLSRPCNVCLAAVGLSGLQSHAWPSATASDCSGRSFLSHLAEVSPFCPGSVCSSASALVTLLLGLSSGDSLLGTQQEELVDLIMPFITFPAESHHLLCVLLITEQAGKKQTEVFLS